MSLEKVQIPSQRPIYPTPAGLVTAVDGDGNPNIITLGEIYNLSIRKPVIVGLGIAPERYSHRLLCQCREVVVNLPTAAILEKVLACGKVSGRDARDKFALAGLTPLPAQRVKPPLIAECPPSRPSNSSSASRGSRSASLAHRWRDGLESRRGKLRRSRCRSGEQPPEISARRMSFPSMADWRTDLPRPTLPISSKPA
jgi:hypothetical protein